MNAISVLKTTLNSSSFILKTYLSDFDDEALMIRPVPGANHLAWQMGHLITAEPHLLCEQFPDAKPHFPELPAGFAEKHSKEASSNDDPAGFFKLAEYLDLYGKTREATLKTLDGLTDADLDKETQGKMAKMFPTLGAIFVLISNHDLMHAGQFAVLRRKLGKPVVI